MSAETPVPEQRIDLASIRRRLADSTGRRERGGMPERLQRQRRSEWLERALVVLAIAQARPGPFEGRSGARSVQAEADRAGTS